MTDPRCDGHENRTRSQIVPPSVTGEWKFCLKCHQKISEEGLTPGEDFGVGELWSRGDGDVK